MKSLLAHLLILLVPFMPCGISFVLPVNVAEKRIRYKADVGRSNQWVLSLAAPVDQVRYKPEAVQGNHYDTIVIGSGIGGLCTASLLAQKGNQKVLVLEQHPYYAGGAMHCFQSRGYRFATGIHYVGDMGSNDAHGSRFTLKHLMDSLTEPDDPVHWDKMDDDQFEEVWFGDKRFEIDSGEENQIEKLIQQFPGERKAIETYYSSVHKARTSYNRVLLLKTLPRPLVKLLLKSGLIRLLDGGFRKWARVTVQEGLEALTDNKELQAVLAYNWGDYGVEPSRAPFVMQLLCASTFLNGGYYPRGGPSVIPKKIIQQIISKGGKVLINAPVKRILVNDSKHHNQVTGVEMSDGTVLSAGTVVSDAGFINTCTKLLPEGMVDVSFAHDDSTSPRESKLHPGSSAISLFVGLKGGAESLNLPTAQCWAYPSIYTSRDAARIKAMSVEEAIAMDPADLGPLFIGKPSVKDSTWKTKFPDRTVLEIIALGPQYAWFEKFVQLDRKERAKDTEYSNIKRALADKMWTRSVEVLSKDGARLPITLAKVDHFEVGTPLTYHHYYKSVRGAFYGLDEDVKRFEPENCYLRLRADVPEVRGLYLTGQDVVASSLAGAMCGGLLCAQRILGVWNPASLLRY